MTCPPVFVVNVLMTCPPVLSVGQIMLINYINCINDLSSCVRCWANYWKMPLALLLISPHFPAPLMNATNKQKSKEYFKMVEETDKLKDERQTLGEN